MYSFITKIRVRYAETDQMGYVYHGNFAMYYEEARTESLRDLGITYKELEEDGIILPVFDLQCKYFKPALYDDLLTVKVIIPELPRVKFEFNFEVYNQKGELLNTGTTVLVFANKETGKPVRLPEKMKKVLEPFFQ